MPTVGPTETLSQATNSDQPDTEYCASEVTMPRSQELVARPHTSLPIPMAVMPHSVSSFPNPPRSLPEEKVDRVGDNFGYMPPPPLKARFPVRELFTSVSPPVANVSPVAYPSLRYRHDYVPPSYFDSHPRLPEPAQNLNADKEKEDNVVGHARSLLAVLSAFCIFGASLAFSTLHADLTRTTHPSSIAWSFASFAIGIVVTLVWQAALISDFRGFTGRLYRSEPGIIAALAMGFAAVTAGTLFLSLSMIFDKDAGVRAAGYAVVSVIGVLFCCSLVRLVFTGARRTARKPSPQAGIQTQPMDPVAPAPPPAYGRLGVLHKVLAASIGSSNSALPQTSGNYMSA